MTINRLNYEIHLIDYLDGQLNASQVDELLLFLDQNPDIKGEIEGIEDAVLVAETSSFPNKSSLKKKSFLKDGIDNEFDYLCISAAEGLLNIDEKLAFEKSIEKDSTKLKTYNEFKKSKLTPNSELRYNGKAHLKRLPAIPIRYSQFRIAINVAAAITLLLGVYTLSRVLINEKSIDNSSVIVESVNSFNPTQEVFEIKKANAVFAKQATTSDTFTQKEASKGGNTLQTKEIARVDREEYIPNRLKRKNVFLETHINPQAKEIAHFFKNNNQSRVIELENLIAQQSQPNTIETIQNGLKAFSRLLGRDITLDAKKDSKGKVEQISFESKYFAFSTQVKNE